MRTIVPRERHPLIFGTFRKLAPGDALLLVNDHDPKSLYYLVTGEHEILGDSKVFWLSRPRGVDWRDAMPGLIRSAGAKVSAWRRQMVLGPSAEFALSASPGISRLSVPKGCTSIAVERRRLR